MKKEKDIVQVKPNSLKKYYYLLGLFTFFVFANTIGNGYNMDDGIVTNGHKLTSQGLTAIGEIFTSNYYSDAMGYAFGYRPMVHLSFALEHEMFGEKPGAGHFINVILFVFSVVLFFKLLVKWVGEKNLLFAGIATVLFAVHPIHTEVVASLKNRDELLAFLFVLWATLSAHKFLEKGKWTSLISIAILFSFAMLSKKSVYPMAIIIPTAIILLKDISIKQLIILGLLFIIPGAVIGSELQLEKMGLMLGLPIIVLVIIYVFKTDYLSNNEELAKIKPTILPVLELLIFSSIAMFTTSIYTLLLTIPFFLWLFKINLEFGLIALIFLSYGMDIVWVSVKDFELLPVILGIGYSTYLVLSTKKINKLWLAIGLVTMAYYLINNHNIASVIFLAYLIIFIFFLLRKNIVVATLLSVIIVITAFYVERVYILALYMVLIGIAMIIYQKTKKNNWIGYATFFWFLLTITNIGIINYETLHIHSSKHAQPVTIEKQEHSKFIKNENILKEGRQLEYVENTLIVPHTKEEKIGTGFATLGEYFRLMTFPYELSFYYGFAKIDTFGLRNVWVWLFIIIHLAMLILAFYHLRKNPIISIGIFWYLLCILLFSNWVELVAGMVGERLAFTASAGFCIFIAGIIFWIKPDLNFKKPGLIEYSVILILIFFTGRTVIRNTDWKNTITLMGHDIEHLTNSSQAHNIYAMHLMAESTNNRTLRAVQIREMQSKAIEHFNRATEIWPDYYNVYIDKARATMLTGDYQEGIKSLEKAKLVDPKNEYSYYLLLDFLDKTGESERYLENALLLFELVQNEHSYGTLARGYYSTNNFQKSKEIILEALTKFPNNDALKYNLTLVEQKIN